MDRSSSRLTKATGYRTLDDLTEALATALSTADPRTLLALGEALNARTQQRCRRPVGEARILEDAICAGIEAAIIPDPPAELSGWTPEYEAHCLAEEAAQEAEPLGYDESTNPSNGWRCPE